MQQSDLSRTEEKFEQQKEAELAKPCTLRFDEADEESSSIASLKDDTLLSWPMPEVEKFGAEVQQGLHNVGDKSKRLSLSALIALLDSLPDEAVQKRGLQESRKDLKSFARLPRQEKVRALLENMESLAREALDVHRRAIQEEADIAKKPELANSPAAEKPPQAACEKGKEIEKWQASDVILFQTSLEDWKAQLAEIPNGQVKKGEIVQLAKQVPARLVPFYPAMMQAVCKAETWTDGY